MNRIKTKEVIKGTIKTLDRSKIALDKTKDTLVTIKEFNRDIDTDGSATNYAEGNITNATGSIANKGVGNFNKLGKKSVIETKNNMIKGKNAIDKLKNKLAERKVEKAGKNLIKVKKPNTIKTGNKLIKTKSVANAVKKQKEAVKKSQMIAKQIKKAIIRTIRAVKATIKWTIRAVKLLIVALKGLIAFLIAGGWIVVLIIIIVCMIGMLVNSIFGIFFASEDVSGSSKPMYAVIREINKEFMDKVTEVQNNNSYDEYTLNGKRAEWKDVLAVYSVRLSGNDMDVVTINDDKIAMLKTIFWEMNTITSSKSTRTYEKLKIALTEISTETVTVDILDINIESKTALQMADIYGFSAKQRQELNELLSEEYAKMWSAVISGSRKSGNDIVEVALSQVGNVGGQPYWSWYGFSARDEWCAMFVSWCGNELGYIEAGIIPKFCAVNSEGISFFKSSGLWQDRSYIPKAGDIIFFDWATDGRNGEGDHVRNS